MNGETLLSHWWKTDSCKRAMARAEKQRRERIDKMRQALSERKAQQQQEIENWKVVE